jgi:6-phosphofructokinase 1
MSRSLRVGLLTGGGDCPGLNAVIRAVTKRLILHERAEVIGFEDGFLGLIERRARPLHYRDASGILTRGGTILGTDNRANPFDFYGSDGADVSDGVMEYVEDLKLDGLITIGGDGTMSVSHRLQERGLNVVGVPKTIDNDLVGTDRTFGFDTAVAIAAEAMDRLHSTAQSHHRVMILETMGRYAGWIALEAGIASGADVILIPEIEYDVAEVARVCKRREQGGQRFTIISMAEGAKPIGGSYTVADTVEDSPDPIRLGGVCRALALTLEPHLDSEIRTTVLGHVQRGGTPTPSDRILATQYGAAAAEMAASGQWGRMVALQSGKLSHIGLNEVADRVRNVPEDHALVRAALSVGTSFGVERLAPEMHRGTPATGTETL